MLRKTLCVLVALLGCAGCRGASLSWSRPLGFPLVPNFRLSNSDAGLKRQVEKDPFPPAKRGNLGV